MGRRKSPSTSERLAVPDQDKEVLVHYGGVIKRTIYNLLKQKEYVIFPLGLPFIRVDY